MKKYIDEHFDEMVADLSELVKYNSVFSLDAKPFGQANRDVLDEALNIFEKRGLKGTNLDYYCGYGEVGDGEKIIGVVGHLDIVPAGEGWNSDPFKLKRTEDALYGRGTSDDKGAVVAAMWAIKYLLDTNYKFKKRVRLIVGTNEESGSLCMNHYREKMGDVDFGFTPDSTFPGVYGEKGILSLSLLSKNSKIISIKAGDTTNMIPRKCEMVLPFKSFDENLLENYLKQNNIKYEINKKDNINLIVYGEAAHASLPELGVNAISHSMKALEKANFDDPYVNFMNKNVGLNADADLLGLKVLNDDVSSTTASPTVIVKEGDVIKTSFDIRYPVKTTGDKCLEIIYAKNDANNTFKVYFDSKPLYFETNSPLVKALDDAYRKATNDNINKMEVVGGGTYAKEMKNIIAFGCEFPDDKFNNIHSANERVTIESFKKQIMCYIEAIKNLNEV